MNIGDKAPEILGKDEQGRDIRLSDYKGRKLVLYFYPKDNTSGCTAEACSLRDHYPSYSKIGFSFPPKKKAKFYQIPSSERPMRP